MVLSGGGSLRTSGAERGEGESTKRKKSNNREKEEEECLQGQSIRQRARHPSPFLGGRGERRSAFNEGKKAEKNGEVPFQGREVTSELRKGQTFL